MLRDFDLDSMDEIRILHGQEWTVAFCGVEARMLVVARDGEIPDTWICEKLSARYDAGTGPHVLVRGVEFLRLERQVE